MKTAIFLTLFSLLGASMLFGCKAVVANMSKGSDTPAIDDGSIPTKKSDDGTADADSDKGNGANTDKKSETQTVTTTDEYIIDSGRPPVNVTGAMLV